MLPGWPWGHQMAPRLSLDVKTVQGTQSTGTLHSEQTGLDVDGKLEQHLSRIFCFLCRLPSSRLSHAILFDPAP